MNRASGSNGFHHDLSARDRPFAHVGFDDQLRSACLEQRRRDLLRGPRNRAAFEHARGKRPGTGALLDFDQERVVTRVQHDFHLIFIEIQRTRSSPFQHPRAIDPDRDPFIAAHVESRLARFMARDRGEGIADEVAFHPSAIRKVDGVGPGSDTSPAPRRPVV